MVAWHCVIGLTVAEAQRLAGNDITNSVDPPRRHCVAVIGLTVAEAAAVLSDWIDGDVTTHWELGDLSLLPESREGATSSGLVTRNPPDILWRRLRGISTTSEDIKWRIHATTQLIEDIVDLYK